MLRTVVGEAQASEVRAQMGVGAVREVRIKMREAKGVVEAQRRHLTLPREVLGRDWPREDYW